MVDIKNLTMYEAVVKAKNDYPKNTAIYYFGATFSYEEMVKKIDAFANGLINLGVKEKDVVTISLPNTPNAIFAFYAINKIGAIANMSHPLTPTGKLIETMDFVNSKFVIMLDKIYYQNESVFISKKFTVITVCPSDYFPPIIKALYNIKEKTGKLKSDYAIPFLKVINDKKETKKVAVNHDTITAKVYLHSGGTTGSPKTIMLSNGNFNSLASNALDILAAKNGDDVAMLAVLPMFHGFGLCMAVHSPLTFGATTVLLPNFSTKSVINVIKKTNVNYIAGVPTMFEKLLSDKRFADDKKNVKLKVAFCGGDSMPKPLKDKFDQTMKNIGGKGVMLEGYGLTETVTVCAVNTIKNNRDFSVGKAIGDIQIKVVDDKGEEVKRGVMGEIAVKGDTVMLGYLKADEATKNTIRGGFVYTGDLGYMDDDGYVYFKQRIKRIIKVSGVAVFPSEIENECMKLPYIKMAAAIGVEDEKCGNVVKLFVVLKNQQQNENYEQKIKQDLSKSLIKWAVPKYVVIKSELPTTLVGKVDVKQLS